MENNINNFNNPILQEDNLQKSSSSSVTWFTAPNSAMIILLLVVLGFYFINSNNYVESPINEEDNSNIPVEEIDTDLEQEAVVNIKDLEKIAVDRWLDVPVNISSINFTSQGSNVTAERKVIGYTKEGKRIIMQTANIDMGISLAFIIEDSADQYSLIAFNSDWFITEGLVFSDNGNSTSTSKIVINKKSYIEEIYSPEVIEFNNVKAMGRIEPYTFEMIKKDRTLKKISDTKWGSVYEFKVKSDLSDKVANYEYILELPSGLAAKYRVESVDILSDDFTLDINFNSNITEKLKETIFLSGIIRGGCGSSGHMLLNLSENDLLKIGTSKSGNEVYRVLPSEKDIFDITYKIYAESKAYQEQESLSRANFDNEVIILVVKNNLGYYENYISNDLTILGECGKPVIYLYPEKETNVSVGVDADITVSEPEYNAGWKVIAMPNGDLKVDDKTYDSLFWEGIGHGQYPKINFGRVVETKNFIAEIRTDLLKFGLNEKEINDFVDFWKDYIPKNNYTRISWLNTKQMNELAPLTITPRPQTVIRVFLDFAGQDTNDGSDYAHQEIVSTPRKGFTVVEWGGLLIK